MTGIASALSLTGLPQKILAGGLGIALIGAVGMNVAQAIENRHLAKSNTTLSTMIDDPKTGYVVKLSQAETNAGSLGAQLTKQNLALKTLSDVDAAKIAGVQKQYDTEHGLRVRAESAAAVFLARKPVGATVCDRVLDVDAQILGDIK